MKVATTLFLFALVVAISAWPVEEEKIGGNVTECLKQAVEGIMKCLTGHEVNAAVPAKVGSHAADNLGGDIVECLKNVGIALGKCIIS